MITVLWVAMLLGIESLVCLFFAPRGLWSTVLAALFLICFALVCWSVHKLSLTDSRKASQP